LLLNLPLPHLRPPSQAKFWNVPDGNHGWQVAQLNTTATRHKRAELSKVTCIQRVTAVIGGGWEIQRLQLQRCCPVLQSARERTAKRVLVLVWSNRAQANKWLRLILQSRLSQDALCKMQNAKCKIHSGTYASYMLSLAMCIFSKIKMQAATPPSSTQLAHPD
jgi:hypothetical protein